MQLRRWIESVAWLAGITLLMLYGSARLLAEHERSRGLELVAAGASVPAAEIVSPSAGDAEPARSRKPRPAEPPNVDQSLWSDTRAREYAKALTRPGRPLGALRIPSVGLAVPVYPGTSELNLNRGAAHIEGTAPLGSGGNVGLAAHRDGFFRSLESLRVDAEMFLDVGTRRLRYRVVEIRIVEPTETHVLAPTTRPSITLVTCYPFYFVGNAPLRYIVRAELGDPADGLAIAGREVSPRSTPTGGAEP